MTVVAMECRGNSFIFTRSASGSASGSLLRMNEMRVENRERMERGWKRSDGEQVTG